jgi:hypothetical protein
MVRPRASNCNLEIAIAFSKVLAVEAEGGINFDRLTWVFCQGERSLYAAFAAGLPELARLGDFSPHPFNRRGVTVVELNKALHSSGMHDIRTQKRPKGMQKEIGPAARLKVSYQDYIQQHSA